MVSFFVQLSLILVLATVLGIVARFLKQPVILAFVLTGILVGPIGLGLVEESEALVLFAQIGVALLLFIVGMSLNPRHLKDVGKISLVAGIGQVVFTSIIGFFLSRALGFGVVESAFISIALTFSSTIIIVKLLTDKNDIDLLYGKIAIGILLVQDFIAVLLLVLVSGFQPGVQLGSVLGVTVLKGLLLIVGLWLFYRFVLRSLFAYISRSNELLFIASISWCFLCAVAAFFLGFTLEIGAFLAGFALASSEFGLEISSRIRPLRDFFVAIFFINLGIGLVFASVQAYFWQIILFSLFILIGNPLIVFFLMTFLGYRSRTSFLTGLTVAQISEFSLILMAVGSTEGFVGTDARVVVTMVGVVTITASTYLILYGNRIYDWLREPLRVFERKVLKEMTDGTHLAKQRYDILLFGCDRTGSRILEKLKAKKVLVVDSNPEIIRSLRAKGVDCVYADADDTEVVDALVKMKPQVLVITFPNLDDTLMIVKKFKKTNPQGLTFATAKSRFEYRELYKNKIDFVTFPEVLAGEKIADYLVHLDPRKIRAWGNHYYKTFLRENKK